MQAVKHWDLESRIQQINYWVGGLFPWPRKSMLNRIVCAVIFGNSTGQPLSWQGLIVFQSISRILAALRKKFSSILTLSLTCTVGTARNLCRRVIKSNSLSSFTASEPFAQRVKVRAFSCLGMFPAAWGLSGILSMKEFHNRPLPGEFSETLPGRDRGAILSEAAHHCAERAETSGGKTACLNDRQECPANKSIGRYSPTPGVIRETCGITLRVSNSNA